ncbi:MAG: hypothetical protein LBS01_05020 [Prevotellaceae bacterium]|jgi:hypothetical protein|nr:hypothetical protein [Prevotellaceae bacterium]
MDIKVITNGGTFRVLMDKRDNMGALCDHLETKGAFAGIEVNQWGTNPKIDRCFIHGSFAANNFYNIDLTLQRLIGDFYN